MTREDAKEILSSMTKGDSLLRHARSVELVMEAYAGRYNEDPEEWAVMRRALARRMTDGARYKK